MTNTPMHGHDNQPYNQPHQNQPYAQGGPQGPGGQQFPGGPPFPGQPHGKKNTPLLIGIALAVVAIIVAIVLIFTLGGGNGGSSKEAKIREYVDRTMRQGFDNGEFTDEEIDEAVDCITNAFDENMTEEQVDDIIGGNNDSVPLDVQQQVAIEISQCLPSTMQVIP